MNNKILYVKNRTKPCRIPQLEKCRILAELKLVKSNKSITGRKIICHKVLKKKKSKIPIQKELKQKKENIIREISKKTVKFDESTIY